MNIAQKLSKQHNFIFRKNGHSSKWCPVVVILYILKYQFICDVKFENNSVHVSYTIVMPTANTLWPMLALF